MERKMLQSFLSYCTLGSLIPASLPAVGSLLMPEVKSMQDANCPGAVSAQTAVP